MIYIHVYNSILAQKIQITSNKGEKKLTNISSQTLKQLEESKFRTNILSKTIINVYAYRQYQGMTQVTK